MSDEYRHDLERRWHDETWCAIAGSPECGCGCIPVAEEIARAMCDRIDELEAENRRMREALKDVLPILDAVRYTVGLRGNQLTRIEKAKAALAEARAALSGEQKP